MLKSKDRFPV